MASDFELIIKKFGNDAGYLEFLGRDHGPTMLTAEMHPKWAATASSDAVRDLVQDRKYIDLLIDAVNLRSFELARKYIDNISDVQAPIDTSKVLIQPGTGLERAFRQPYVGNAVNTLYEYLKYYNTKYCQDPAAYYGKVCSVIQSSGTGKTRTIIELLRTKVPGLYMNIPTSILAIESSQKEYAENCVVFFTAVFIALRKDLESKGITSDSEEADFIAWSMDVCDLGSRAPPVSKSDRTASRLQPSLYFPDAVRKQFFKNLQQEHGMALTAIRSGGCPASTQLELAGEQSMKKAYHDLVACFPNFFTQDSSSLKMVIAIDSASRLGVDKYGFQPSRVLCEVVRRLSRDMPNLSPWFIFVYSGISAVGFSTPGLQGRVTNGDEQHFPPYSAFSWDQMAKPLSDIEPERVAQISNVVRFGRPLWQSLTHSIPSEVRILQTAKQKLCLSQWFDVRDRAQALAVLSQRFCLDPRFGHPESRVFQIEAVANHLRVCLDTTANGIWQETLYPSEPLLACAASELLHTPNSEWSFNTNLTLALRCLCEAMEDGLMEVANKGQPASRVVYLIAKDLCVRSPSPRLWTNPISTKWEETELKDCRPLAVTDYLGFLFGQAALEQDMKELLEDWYIDFSHWIYTTEQKYCITWPRTLAQALAHRIENPSS